MITLFEDFNKPDLRKVGKVVKCIKTSKYFTKDSYYNVKGFYGDPQSAIEEYGINDYLPVECISVILIIGDDGEIYNFDVNIRGNYFKPADVKINGEFFENFEIQDFVKNIDKFNI